MLGACPACVKVCSGSVRGLFRVCLDAFGGGPGGAVSMTPGCVNDVPGALVDIKTPPLGS